MRSLAWIRHVALSLLGGIMAGALVGVLARLAMRLAGWMAPREGAVTVERAVVGDVTWSGTIAVIIIGVFVGLSGGAAHALARGALPERGRGLWTGALLLALFGWTIVDPANTDFRRFGWAPLNDAIFAALFLVFGFAVDRLASWLDARAPRSAWALVLYAPVAIFGGALALMNGVFGTDRYPALGLAAALALVGFSVGMRVRASRRASAA